VSAPVVEDLPRLVVDRAFGARCPLCPDHRIVAAGCGTADEAADELDRHVDASHGGWR
jgi:hypothetical protein